MTNILIITNLVDSLNDFLKNHSDKVNDLRIEVLQFEDIFEIYQQIGKGNLRTLDTGIIDSFTEKECISYLKGMSKAFAISIYK